MKNKIALSILILIIFGFLLPRFVIPDTLGDVSVENTTCAKVEALVFFDNPIQRIWITKYQVIKLEDKYAISTYTLFGIPYIKINTRCLYAPLIQDIDVKLYLEENLIKPAFSGKMFCTFKTIGEEQNLPNIKKYVWAYCEEYYLQNGEIRAGTELSWPVVLSIDIEEIVGKYVIRDHEQTRNGVFMAEDQQRIFPERYQRILNANQDWINKTNLKSEAEMYFKVRSQLPVNP